MIWKCQAGEKLRLVQPAAPEPVCMKRHGDDQIAFLLCPDGGVAGNDFPYRAENRAVRPVFQTMQQTRHRPGISQQGAGRIKRGCFFQAGSAVMVCDLGRKLKLAAAPAAQWRFCKGQLVKAVPADAGFAGHSPSAVSKYDSRAGITGLASSGPAC